MIQYYILVAAAVAAISYTITQKEVFLWLRQLVVKSKVLFLIQLVHCPWCMSHYVLAFLSLFIDYPIRMATNPFMNVLCNYFAVLGLASIFLLVMLKAFSSSMDLLKKR